MRRPGYEIVCPDGVRRHLPYGNAGDAEFDAALYGESPVRCRHWDNARDVGPCPGGKHQVVRVVFDDGGRA